jgi:hypothetical protein
MSLLLVLLAGFGAGFINALAGGGSFLTFPSLISAGLPAIDANATSTIALFPAQVATTYAYRDTLQQSLDDPRINGKILAIISLVGGLAGALLLLATPESLFERSVPYLLGIATLVFAFGMVMPKDTEKQFVGPVGILISQVFVSIYGGYFGGGIGLLMMAALTMAGLAVRAAGATKNILAGVINASAVALFVFSPDVHWLQVAVTTVGASIGGWLGALTLQKVNEKTLRVGVVAIGVALTIGLFIKAP